MSFVEAKLRISGPVESPRTRQQWPPSDFSPSRERLEEWLALFVAIGRWDQVERCEQRLFTVLDSPAMLHEALLRSGDRWWRTRGDLARARVRYREALCVDGRSERANARLRSVAHEIGRRRVQPFRRA